VLNISKHVVAHCSTELSTCLPAGKHSKLNTQCSIFNVERDVQPSTVNRQLSAVNCQLSAVNCKLQTVNCKLSSDS